MARTTLALLLLAGCTSPPARWSGSSAEPTRPSAHGVPATTTTLPRAVRGARWQYVGTSAGGDPVVYVDANARHDHRRFRTAWRRDEHPGGSAHVSVEIVDCARHRSRTAKVTAYRADGTVLTRDHFNESEAPFFEPTPGSVGAAFVDVVCGRG